MMGDKGKDWLLSGDKARDKIRTYVLCFLN